MFPPICSLVLLASLSVLPLPGAESEARTTWERSPWYFAVGGGVNQRSDAADEPACLSFDTGFLVSGALGIRAERLDTTFLQDFRLELEYARQFNETDEIELRNTRNGPLSGNPEDARGRVDIESYQVVLAYDFPLRKWTAAEERSFLYRCVPFIGVGLGANRVIVNDLGSSTLDIYLPPRFNMNASSDYAFCVSPRFGVTYEISRHFGIYAMGMYHHSESLAIQDPFGSVNHPTAETWSAGLGLRWNL